jgi:diguanylate cyclase (GGDEF)-like protein
MISLFSMRKISEEHTTEFLKTLSIDVYHSISDELTETIEVSKAVANDSLLIDLLEQESEFGQDFVQDQLAAYTSRLMDTFSYSWVYIVSDQSKAYYTDDGIYRIIDPENNPDDAWYADFVNLGQEYDVTIGEDNDIPDVWTVFVDTRIENQNGEFLGVCGMALEIHDLQELLRNYEEEYGISILFVDGNGQLQLQSGNISEYALQTYKLSDPAAEEEITMEQTWSKRIYTIIRRMEYLDWYMVICDINPYHFTTDYLLIGLSVIVFVIFMVIVGICLRHISDRAGSLYTDSYTDMLTGLFNRRAFEDHIDHLRNQTSLEDIIIVALDVNSLKQVNDSLGHAAGDELITGSASLIQETFAPFGKCYRTGGDEFVAILEKPVSDISVLTTQFDLSIANWHGKYIDHITISYGIVCGSDPSCTIDQLILLADEQMYRRKKAYYQTTSEFRR